MNYKVMNLINAIIPIDRFKDDIPINTNKIRGYAFQDLANYAFKNKIVPGYDYIELDYNYKGIDSIIHMRCNNIGIQIKYTINFTSPLNIKSNNIHKIIQQCKRDNIKILIIFTNAISVDPCIKKVFKSANIKYLEITRTNLRNIKLRSTDMNKIRNLDNYKKVL